MHVKARQAWWRSRQRHAQRALCTCGVGGHAVDSLLNMRRGAGTALVACIHVRQGHVIIIADLYEGERGSLHDRARWDSRGSGARLGVLVGARKCSEQVPER